ncbi:MAG: response regulator [Bdellovibrionales bacterium]|nr:response regulator [Bdellovibrionales bacterium]
MKVLVADDDKFCCSMLKRFLTEWGYQPVVCADGQEAWDVLKTDESPRVALLDWHMPKFDGIDLCKMIRQREEEVFIYPILITGKCDVERELEALENGAYDFISKPYNPSILKARLEVGSKVARSHEALNDISTVFDRYGSHMEHLAEERMKSLIHAERMTTLGVMSAGIAHEINNPMSFISGNVQILEKFWEDLTPFLDKACENQEHAKNKIQFIKDEVPQIIESMHAGVNRVTRIVKKFATFSGQRETSMLPCDLNACVKNALEIAETNFNKNISVLVDLDESIEPVLADAQEIEQVLINLFINASHAMEKQAVAELHASTRQIGKYVVIGIQDTGTGIPEDKIEKIWNHFFTTKERGKGTGLGLSISKEIIQNHGGKIFVTNVPEGGAKFVIKLRCIED